MLKKILVYVSGLRRTVKTRAPLSTNYVVYYRIKDQKYGGGLDLGAQRQSVESYVERVGGIVLSEYTEVETGKRHGKRPQLAAAIAECKRGAGAVLLIAKLDRLARNVAFISNLMESAADFVVADMPIANPLTIHVLAAVAEYESEMLSKRSIAGLAVAKARGKKLGNPDWAAALAKANAVLAARKAAQQDHTALLRRLRTDGLSLRQIAKQLNALGIKSPSGAVWHPSRVRKALLSSPELRAE